MRDEFDIYHYQGSEYAWEQLTKAEKIEDLEKRIETCRYFIEAWTDAYNQLKREWEELTEARK
tara:strand:+ start:2699 stop:2887 length:189 start_codon:yes stop_codon:yes gene_type:complete